MRVAVSAKALPVASAARLTGDDSSTPFRPNAAKWKSVATTAPERTGDREAGGAKERLVMSENELVSDAAGNVADYWHVVIATPPSARCALWKTRLFMERAGLRWDSSLPL